MRDNNTCILGSTYFIMDMLVIPKVKLTQLGKNEWTKGVMLWRSCGLGAIVAPIFDVIHPKQGEWVELI